MSRLLALCIVLPLALPSASGAAQRHRDQDLAYDKTRAGEIRPLREIENRVVPRMGGARYLGPEIYEDGRYRLKFMRGESVIWVDVDGRTGAIIGRSGR